MALYRGDRLQGVPVHLPEAGDSRTGRGSGVGEGLRGRTGAHRQERRRPRADPGGSSPPSTTTSRRGGASPQPHPRQEGHGQVGPGGNRLRDQHGRGRLEEVLGGGFRILRLSGGGARSHLWNQIQSDIYGRPVERLEVSECTTLGAAILGAVGCGVLASVNEAVGELVHPFDTIEPDVKDAEMYRAKYGIFATPASCSRRTGYTRGCGISGKSTRSENDRGAAPHLAVGVRDMKRALEFFHRRPGNGARLHRSPRGRRSQPDQRRCRGGPRRLASVKKGR